MKHALPISYSECGSQKPFQSLLQSLLGTHEALAIAMYQNDWEMDRSIYETTYSPPECPFCGKIEGCSQDMEIHVKTKHASLLESPLKGKVLNLFKLL